LTQLNVTTFDDFVKFVPNVSTAGSGPGQNSIFMRGLSVGVTGQQGTGTTGPIPNVAVYLDEISGALPGRNMDVYAADIERIELAYLNAALHRTGGKKSAAAALLRIDPQRMKYLCRKRKLSSEG